MVNTIKVYSFVYLLESIVYGCVWK